MTRKLLLLVFVGLIASSCSVKSSSEKRYTLERDSREALSFLYSTTPAAKALGNKARAVLVFPNIVKGGFVFGGSFGEGVLFKGDAVAGYYNTVSGSWGLQAGLQKFGYAMFFMKESDLAYLNKSEGWEVGVGPSITVLDEGMARSFSTTTAREGVYAFFFEQKGLMAGLGLQGTKITKIEP